MEERESIFHSIEEVTADLKNGKMVIVMDDEGRENEGDLLVAAEHVTPEIINFMAKYARGLICIPMEEKRLNELGLHPMKNGYSHPLHKPSSTGWTISVDAAHGITTGISAHDRAYTVKVLIDPNSKPGDLETPGHLFPLRARDGGVLVRAGHTEASVDLMKIAGLRPAGVICEIMNDDGTMARTEDIIAFSKEHNIKICGIADLIEYRNKFEKLIEKVAETELPTDYGNFKAAIYESKIDGKQHLALVMGEIDPRKPELVRVHSESLLADVFGSRRCDGNSQLHNALKAIQENRSGVFLYMRQEGRGIGLLNKIKAYELQDEGLDTVEANKALGFAADFRDYGIGAQILADLGIKEMRLLTNNPKKIVGLEGYGLTVIERIPIKGQQHENNKNYLKAIKEKLGHIL